MTIEAINAYVPTCYTLAGKWVMSFGENPAIIYETYKSMPDVLKRDGVFYRKSGYNSDFGRIYYKEIAEKDMAFPV